MKRNFATILIVTLATLPLFAQPGSRINDTPHNLSAASANVIRANSEQQVCIFCHTPHNARPMLQLWNRNDSVSAYTIYASPSLKALPGQPTGTSKLCLSCHDGTIALGSVISRTQMISMVGGITTLPPGASNLGTDLSDDHPISFQFNSALVTLNSKLKDPSALPNSVKLDKNAEMQCTTCHQPHNNQYGKFLVMDNSTSQLCNTCHISGPTDLAPHDQCASCHQPHSAPSGPYLLKGTTVHATCATCHTGLPGSGTAQNLSADFAKACTHDTQSAVDIASPIPNHVSCSDCHEPHTMTSTVAVAPNVQGNFGTQSGINAAGVDVVSVQYQYEVCFKCHADNPATTPTVSRQLVQGNTRLEFDPTAISFHPVETTGKNTNVPSLKPGFNTSSIIYCTDCHNSDDGTSSGGTGPDGPHGSAQAPMLMAQYDTADFTTESVATYALCYKCHDRTSILNDESFKYHKKHIQERQTPCSACHDAHGIASAQGTAANNSHLINFDTTIVFPFGGITRFTDTGTFTGNCTLTCHSKDHNNLGYAP